jgi:hypothetical protein
MVAKHNADSIECTRETVYQTAWSSNSRDHTLNRLLTRVRNYICMIYVLNCSSHSGVSSHYAKYSELSPRKEIPIILKTMFLAPPFPLSYAQSHICYYISHHTNQVLTVIVLGRCQITKSQMYSLRYSQGHVWNSVRQLTIAVQTEHKTHIPPLELSAFPTCAS